MALDAFDQFIRHLVVAVMNARLYSARHEKAVSAAGEVAESAQPLLGNGGDITVGIAEDLVVYQGRPRPGLGRYALRFVKLLRDRGFHGFEVGVGVTTEDVTGALELLLDRSGDSAGRTAPVAGSPRGRFRFLTTPLAAAQMEGTDEIVFSVPVSRGIYDESLAMLDDAASELKSGKTPSLGRANALARNLVEQIHDCRAGVVSLTAFKNYDDYTLNHSVNVGIFTAAIAKTFTRENDVLVDIARAALLHDVGKMLIPEEILFKPGRLTRRERELMQTHTELGAKLILGERSLGPLAIEVAVGHHLRFDGSGYPRFSVGVRQTPVVSLVNLADVYEAMTAHRPYKESMPPEEAAAIITEGSGSEFRPQAVAAFVRALGLWPEGTQVVLSSGATGVVTEVNHQDPFRPKVSVRSPDGTRSEVDLAEPGQTVRILHSLAS